jgi:cytochrome P450
VDSENVDKRKNKLSEAEIAAQTGILLIGGQDMTEVDH